MRVQLLYFPGCPNLDAARGALDRALSALGLLYRIEEVDVTDESTPEELRGWGSPTVLIDGTDVGGEIEPTGAVCRLYTGDVRGAPSDAAICAALLHRAPRRTG